MSLAASLPYIALGIVEAVALAWYHPNNEANKAYHFIPFSRKDQVVASKD
jgi:hypothetical protein